MSWELERQLIEALAAGIEVETLEVCAVKQARENKSKDEIARMLTAEWVAGD